jgi:hypothetical protein
MRNVLAGAMKEKLLNLFLFVTVASGLVVPQILQRPVAGDAEQEAWLARRGITRSSLVARWLSLAV